MKKRVCIVLICCVMLFSACNSKQTRYKRISFENETMGEAMKCITADTSVVYKADETFQNRMPIYEIKKHAISDQEFQQMKERLGITDWYWNKFNGYEIYSMIAPSVDPARGYYYTLGLTDEELEELAWETFEKLPFMEGEYEYIGITATGTIWSMEMGEQVSDVTVTFRRILNGTQIIGNDECDLTFDASGLQAMRIALFDYNEIGTMDMVPLKEAQEKIKTPDSFSIDQTTGVANNLQVDRVQVFWVNQFSEGCGILQPIYTFYGTASFEDGAQREFRSRIIAIPESMTYVEE